MTGNLLHARQRSGNNFVKMSDEILSQEIKKRREAIAVVHEDVVSAPSKSILKSIF